MNSQKTRCPWCSRVYTASGAYTNHILKHHPEHAQQTISRLPRRQPDASEDSPEGTHPTAEAPSPRSGSSEVYESDIDPTELAQIYDDYDDIESADNEESDDESDVEASPERPAFELVDREPNAYTPNIILQMPSRYHTGEPIRPFPFSKERSLAYNYLHPFLNPRDYKLAQFFTLSKVPKTRIDDFFRDNILSTSAGDPPTSQISYKSTYTFYKQIAQMVTDSAWTTGSVEYALCPKGEFYYQDIIECIQYLLVQCIFVPHMIWEPVKCNIPVGSMLIPVLLASDQTHLTNYSGDKKLWPLYMSIGNIKSTIRNKPTMNAWIPIALLPVPPKRLYKIPNYSTETQELNALQITHEILSHILSPLADAKTQEGIEMVYCNENIYRCVPKLFAWLADHMENATIHGIASNHCPICVAPPNEFGELSERPYEIRPHPQYAVAYQNTDVQQLEADGVKNINNALWYIPHCEPYGIVRPDMLHTLLLRILTHLMKWVLDFLEHIGRLTIFDHLWSRLPPFPEFTRPNKAYRSISQWQGKEMRNLLRVLLGVFTAVLSQTTDITPIVSRHKSSCRKAILCVRYITDFMLMAQYQTHTLGTIQSMKDYLSDFHEYKDVFLRFHATKATKNAAKQATKDLHAPCPPRLAKRQKLQEQFRTEVDELVDNLLSTGAHYNFPKIHLISHFADQIVKYGSLPQYSTEICEASHKPLKDRSRRSNHVNPIPQIIRTYTRAYNFAMRERNIEQWLVELPYIPDEVAIPTFNGDGHMIHHIRCTGGELFRKQDQRHDWVFARRRGQTGKSTPGALNGRVPARLNALFKLQNILENTCYRLAHISLLTIVGSPTPDGPEGMIADIEGMAHLITINPDQLYLVNNRIDLHTWNDIHDGN
ncbi:hypothetical protein EV426DRAFT_579176 [Tirmania nivea]|nr:hypothetical protein EV426DRAFT_579176 [Tirmania nivea]